MAGGSMLGGNHARHQSNTIAAESIETTIAVIRTIRVPMASNAAHKGWQTRRI